MGKKLTKVDLARFSLQVAEGELQLEEIKNKIDAFKSQLESDYPNRLWAYKLSKLEEDADRIEKNISVLKRSIKAGEILDEPSGN